MYISTFEVLLPFMSDGQIPYVSANRTWNFWGNLAGRVAEFDTPARLLEDKSSMFLKLVTEYSSRSSGIPDF